MEPATIQWPSRGELEVQLGRILGAGAAGGVEVVDRHQNVVASSAPSELVTCRLPGERTVRLVCKNASRRLYPVDSRPAGGWYEAQVYRSVLAACRGPVPRFHGAWQDGDTGEVWLAIEYLEDTCWLAKAVDQSRAMAAAAAWIGSFHADNEPRLGEPGLAFLHRYDAEHYRRQIEHIQSQTHDLAESHPWLPRLLGRFEAVAEILDGARQTVIHGEYYPKNVLVQAGNVVPIDWETAAIGAGEIDFACLTEGWHAAMTETCRRAYLQARLGTPEAAGLERAFAAARAYVSAYWLGFWSGGDRSRNCLQWMVDWRLDQLLEAGRRLGLA